MRSSSLLIFIFIICLSSCSRCGADRLQNYFDSALKDAKHNMELDSADIARQEQLEHQIDSIIAENFVPCNGINDAVIHKNWKGSPDADRNGLAAVLYPETGNMVLISTLPEFHDHLHNSVQIVFEDSSWSADSNYTYPLTVPDGMQYTAVPNAKGEVLYILEEQAKVLIRAIIANPTKKIKVNALFGSEVYASYVLSEEDRKAIIDTYQLQQLILEKTELENKHVDWDD
jgi:hypothetical protein